MCPKCLTLIMAIDMPSEVSRFEADLRRIHSQHFGCIERNKPPSKRAEQEAGNLETTPAQDSSRVGKSQKMQRLEEVQGKNNQARRLTSFKGKQAKVRKWDGDGA